MTLYGIQKGEISPSEYITLEHFAFELDDYLFFTDRDTATRLGGGSDVVEWKPVN